MKRWNRTTQVLWNRTTRVHGQWEPTKDGEVERSETGENPTDTSLIKGEKLTPESPIHGTRLQATCNDIRSRAERDWKEIDRRLESD